jgi:hypothetical protein
MLCPKCGCIMVVDSTNCAVTPQGMVCCACTEQLRDALVVTKSKLLASIGIPIDQQTVKCFKCDKELVSSDSIYVYGHNLFLCRRHHSPYLAKEIASHTSLSLDETKQLILDHLARKQTRVNRVAIRHNKGRGAPKKRGPGGGRISDPVIMSHKRRTVIHNNKRKRHQSAFSGK